jgi:primary-amine oxidase
MEAVVDLQNKKILSWTPIKGAHGMVLLSTGVPCRAKAHTAALSGSCREISVKRVFGWNSGAFINDVFQSGLDQTFQVEKRPHPLNSLSAAEISEAGPIPPLYPARAGKSQ